MTSMLSRMALAALALCAIAQTAHAQLTSAQQSAMRSNCRSDFMSKCSGVTPGGKEALQCLQQNVATLSPGCKSVVGTTMAAPAAAPATASAPPPPKTAARPPAPKTTPHVTAAAPAAPTAAQQSAMKQACRSDFMSHCSGVTPGGKDALACLQRNVGALSPTCKKVVASTMPGAGAHTAAHPPAATPARAAAAPAAAAAAPAAAETEQQATGGGFVPGAGIVMKACARDLLLHCPGIAGNGKAVACLRAREASGHRLGIRCGIALKMQAKMQH